MAARWLGGSVESGNYSVRGRLDRRITSCQLGRIEQWHSKGSLHPPVQSAWLRPSPVPAHADNLPGEKAYSACRRGNWIVPGRSSSLVDFFPSVANSSRFLQGSGPRLPNPARLIHRTVRRHLLSLV